MNAPDRFALRPATREQTPLLIGLVGPSGSGKTFSALRLAAGIQSVVGGVVAVIDTEARRALHYAGKFAFRHMDFAPPHGPDSYLEAIRTAVAEGARTIVVDSMSHEHEGEGGVLEWHEAELDRIAGDDFRKREAVNLLGWAKPKGARRKLINGLLQLHANFIFCFRAKEKVKMVKNAQGKAEIVPLGWQAIAGDEFVYEMVDRFLLLPGAEGRPAWDTESLATGVPKLTEDHRELLSAGDQLDERIGAALAEWAMGRPAAPVPLGAEVVEAFARLGITQQQIDAHLGHPATAADTQALRTWYAVQVGAQATPKPAPRQRTRRTPTAPIESKLPSYAQLAEELNKAPDSEAALLVLDRAGHLPFDQRRDLHRLADSRFGEQGGQTA